MDETMLKGLGIDATAVAGEHDALRAATQGRIDAEAALLQRLIEVVKPALPALSSRISIGERTWWPTNATTDTHRDFHSVPGLLVDGSGPEEDHPQANGGAFEGRGLYLLRDGTLEVLTYSGTWSRWQGAESQWVAEGTPVTAREAIAGGWELDAIAERVAKAVSSHKGKRRDRAASESARAAKVRALSDLLGK